MERFLRGGAFELILSPAIAEEVFRVLAYPKIRKLLRETVQAELWFEDVLVLAELVEGRQVHERDRAYGGHDDARGVPWLNLRDCKAAQVHCRCAPRGKIVRPAR